MSINIPWRRALAASVALAVLDFAPRAAIAADAVVGLEEVVVTSRKREENLQDVPLSIVAFGEDELRRLNVRNAADLARYDASLKFDYGYSSTDTRIVLRGLSPTRGRTNVAVLVDGVNVSTESVSFAGGGLLATQRLIDAERIEIVKGPQSALYGRGAFAGAIQYVTKDPGREFEASVRGDVAEYGREELGFAVGGPLSDTFGLRLNGSWWNSDGVYREQARLTRVGGGDGWGAALVGKWQPTDALTARARIEHSDDHFTQGQTASLRRNFNVAAPSSCLGPNGTAPCVYAATRRVIGYRGPVTDADGLTVNFSPDPRSGTAYPGTDRQVSRASLTIDWNLGRGTLTSITGYTDAKFHFLEDGDFDALLDGAPGSARDTATRAALFDFDNATKQFTQELRYTSDLDGPLNFTLDALYWHDDERQVGRSANVYCLPPFAFGQPFATCGTRSAAEQLGLLTTNPRTDGRIVNSLSFAARVEWQFAPRWNLALESRYSDERETTLGTDCNYALYPTQGTQRCLDPSLFAARVPFAIFGPSINFLFDPTQQGVGAQVRLPTESTSNTPRASLEFKATDRILVYASAAKGVKPGGFSTVAAGAWSDNNFDGNYDEIRYGPERLWAYELGAKADWLEGRLRTNLAAYWQDYKGKQQGAQTITPSGIAVGRILNAGSATVKGIELDARWKPTESLLFSLNYAYTNGRFDEFTFLSNSSTDAVRAGACNAVVVPPATTPICRIDLAGRRVEDVPEHAVVLLGRYERALGVGGLRWFLEGDVSAQGERYIDAFNTRWVDDYVLGNVRVGVTGRNWEALVYVNNVSDDRTILSAQDSPGDVDSSLPPVGGPTNFSPADDLTVHLPDPRIVGLRFSWKF